MTKTERIERTLPVPEGCQLEVANISGSITITGVESDKVHILATKHWRSRHEAEATEIEIGQQGGHVWARTSIRRTQGWWNLWGRREAVKVDYVIELPRQSQVTTNSVSASTQIHSMEGKLEIETVSGSVAIQDLLGALSIRSVSGDVTGRALCGQLHLEAVSGRADLTDSDFASFRVATVSGPVRIATDLHPAGEYAVNTVSGNVELLVPATVDCTIQGHSISGRLRTTLAHISQRQGFGSWHAEVGHGGVRLGFNSVSGDLVLTAVGSEIAAKASVYHPMRTTIQNEAKTTLTAPSYRSPMDVLRAIEAGQLGVEEGKAQLRELKGRREA